MACAYPEDTDFDWELQKHLQKTFIRYVSPPAVLQFFHQYDSNVLTRADIQKVRARTDQHGDSEGASLLLDRLRTYDGWFSCLMKVLRDPDVKLSHAADIMEDIRHQVEVRLETGDSKPDDVKPKTNQLPETRNGKTKLTDTLHTERRNVDKAIEDLHNEHEARIRHLEQENGKLCQRILEDHEPCELKARQLEQEKEQELRAYQDQVRKLKKEREKLEQFIQRDRKQRDLIKLHEEKICELNNEARQKDQLIAERDTQIAERDTQITNLRSTIESLEMGRNRSFTRKKEISDLLSATQENDGVILFNYYVMYGMRRKHPDLAKKYKIQEWSAPSHLQDTAKWIVRVWDVKFYESQVREVKEGGLSVAKEIIQTELRGILNNVNMRKEKAMKEDEEKRRLQRDIMGFFRSCYWCLIGLQGHNINELQQCLCFIQGVLSEDLNKLVQARSDWPDLMSRDTHWKGFMAQNIGGPIFKILYWLKG